MGRVNRGKGSSRVNGLMLGVRAPREAHLMLMVILEEDHSFGVGRGLMVPLEQVGCITGKGKVTT